MLIASRMAVPPRESMRAMPSSIFLMSLVNGTSRNGSSLKLTMNTSSCGLEALTKSNEAASTLCRFSRMLPLLSTMIPSEIGTSSRRNILMGCSIPFSKTLNAFCCKSVTSLPLLSSTLTGSTTRRVPMLKVGSSGEEGACCEGVCGELLPGSWAQIKQEAASKNRVAPSAQRGMRSRRKVENRGPLRCARFLLRRRIVPEAEKRFEWRKPARLHQLDVDVPVLAVPRLVGGAVIEDVLIAKLDSNFGCDVGKFVQILYIITAAARQFGHFVQQARAHGLFRSPA